MGMALIYVLGQSCVKWEGRWSCLGRSVLNGTDADHVWERVVLNGRGTDHDWNNLSKGDDSFTVE